MISIDYTLTTIFFVRIIITQSNQKNVYQNIFGILLTKFKESRMIRIMLLGMVLWSVSFTVLAEDADGVKSYQGSKAVFAKISSPDASFFNPYCVVFHIRASRWNDMKVAAGYSIDKIDIKPQGWHDDLGRSYSLVNVYYVSREGQRGETFSFKCLEKVVE